MTTAQQRMLARDIGHIAERRQPAIPPLRPALGLLIVAAAAGCQPAQEGVTITLWHQMVPSERQFLESEICRFQQHHPGVRVVSLYKETEELRSGFQAAVLVGVGPDLVYGPSDPLGPFQTMGLVRDMSRWFSPEELAAFRPDAITRLPSLTDPTHLELLHIGDRIGNHLALVYNRRYIKEPPKTTSQWIRLAQANTVDVDGDGTLDRYGLVWNFVEPYFAIPFLTGQGGWLFADDSRQPSLNTPAMVSALQFILALRDQYHVLPAGCDYELADALFKNGQAAMIINGDWSWQGYLGPESKIDAAIAPLPVVDATGLPMGPMVDAKGFCLSSVAQGAQARWAMEFVRHMTSAATQRRAMHQLHILPSRSALYADPIFATDATLMASLQQLERGRRTPVVAELRAVWDGMRPHYQSLLGGDETPQAAAEKMQASAELLIQRMQADHAPVANANAIFGAVLLAIAAGTAAWYWKALRRLPTDLMRQPIAYLFMAPSMVVLVATIAYPFGYNIALSLSNMTLNRFRDWSITGWQHYRDVLTSPSLLAVFWQTVVWTVVNVFFHVVLGVLLAVLLHGVTMGKTLYRVILILPWAIPSYITALTWRGMFDYHYGVVNRLATTLLGIERVDWLGDRQLAMVACIITNIWLGVPFMMVIALGGLQGISPELYDAARIDRASRWSQFWHITLPMLWPVLVPAITLGTIWTFNNLNVIWLVSNGGQPADQTHILVSYVYRAVFNLYQFGFGAALSMVIFLILLVWSIGFLALTRAKEPI